MVRFQLLWLGLFLVSTSMANGQAIFSQEVIDQDLKDVKIRISGEEAKLSEIVKTKEDLNRLWASLIDDLLQTQKQRNELE